jgi:tellurite methyltransferase
LIHIKTRARIWYPVSRPQALPAVGSPVAAQVGEDIGTSAIDFFEAQFRRQVGEGDFALNPFEMLALPYVRGRVLDLGCGLGNLSLAAARRGCTVLALDASATAVERIRGAATALDLRAERVELADYRIVGEFDTIIAIGLLMFMTREAARALLTEIRAHVAPGGCAIVNVLTEGTTYLGMFGSAPYYLFGPRELEEAFGGWRIVQSRPDRFDAPGATEKRFATVVARKPA